MLTDVSVFSAVKRLRWMWKQICCKSARVTLGVLWRQHRAEAPEVTVQWRANWFSYRINRSACQSQAKLMARVFSSALLGMFAWRCHPDAGAVLLNNREKFSKTAPHIQQRHSWRRLLKFVFLRIPQSSHKLLNLPRNQNLKSNTSQTISAILLHWVRTDKSHTSHAKVKLTTKQLTREIFKWIHVIKIHTKYLNI